MTTLNTVFLDPNYDPEATYCQIEGYLLLCDSVYVYAPNATAMERAARSLTAQGWHSLAAPVSPTRFARLVAAGHVVPVAAPRYWNREWRTERAATLALVDAERSDFYRWSDDFDAQMAATGRYEHRFYKSAEWARNLETRNPDEFGRIVSQIAELRRNRQLPKQFFGVEYTPRSDAEIASELLHNLGGDIGLLRDLKADAIILSEDQQPLHALYAKLRTESPYARREVFPPVGEDIQLTKADFDIAAEFGRRLAGGYEILDIIDEYKSSNFQRCFRSFVMLSVPVLLREGYSERQLVDGLFALFNAAADDIRKFCQTVGSTVGSLAGAGAYEALARNRNTKQFLENSFGRRTFLRLLGILGGGLGGAYLLPEPIAKAFVAMTPAHDEWIALVALKARRRA